MVFVRSKEISYRIGYAYSKDGINWQRNVEYKDGPNVSLVGWDSKMIAYPHVFKMGEKKYMLYCGNGGAKRALELHDLTKMRYAKNRTFLIFALKVNQEIFYRCPLSLERLCLENTISENGKIVSGDLCINEVPKYRINDGIPDFRVSSKLPKVVKDTLSYYEKEADVYDKYLPLTFATFNVDEYEIRNQMVDLLCLEPKNKVLETGCGTGRDTEIIASRLKHGGELHAQDLSPSMLKQAKQKLEIYDKQIQLEFSIGDATYLPYPDNYFDAAYHFGGLNTFGDIKKAFNEISRVVKVGGKVVVGDESMPPWLRESEFGKILINSNPHYKYNLPLQLLPECARDVNLRWIIGGVFYLFDFTVGDGAPDADYDFAIPGPRGGSHRTRYYGNLEGVTSEAKALAIKAQKLSGKSMHEWLTDVIKSAASSELS